MESLPDDPDGAVWRALANPWRRRILDVLRTGPRRTGELTDELGISRQHLVGHLDVLRAAGLVHTVAEGRVRQNHLDPAPLRAIAERWLSPYEAVWNDALRGLKDDLERTGAGEARRAPQRTERKEQRRVG